MAPYPQHLSSGSSDVPLPDGKLRLYSMRFCPFAQRVHLVLNAKNIPHDIVNINLKAKPEWFLDKFPLGKVPTVVLPDGSELYESLIICDYLDDAYPGEKLTSSDSLQKAKDRILVELFNKVISSYYAAVWTQVIDKSSVDTVFNELDVFEKELIKRGTQYFAGKKPGMVDYMIWPWFERLEMVKILGKSNQFKVPKEKFPKLIEWGINMCNDPAVKDYLLTPEAHAKFAQSYLTGTPDYDNVIHGGVRIQKHYSVGTEKGSGAWEVGICSSVLGNLVLMEHFTGEQRAFCVKKLLQKCRFLHYCLTLISLSLWIAWLKSEPFEATNWTLNLKPKGLKLKDNKVRGYHKRSRSFNTTQPVINSQAIS